MRLMFLGLGVFAAFSLSACASLPPAEKKVYGSISVYELRHSSVAKTGNILVHGVFQLSIESLIVKDEKCTENVVGLEIPEAIEKMPSVKKFYSALIKNPTPNADKAVYATVVVSPQYDVIGHNILKLNLVDVVSQSVSSAKMWEQHSASAKSISC